jgi:hypothetical protein
MKIIYDLIDGGRISADNAHDFVTKLRLGSFFDSHGTNNAYMRRFAKRYKIQSGTAISTANPDAFLQDLIKTGYAKAME